MNVAVSSNLSVQVTYSQAGHVQYCAPEALAAVEQTVSNQINTTKLLAVEKLLWGHTPKMPGEGMRGA